MNFRNYINKHSILLVLLFTFVLGTFSQLIRVKEHKENDHWVYYRTAKRIESNNIKEIYSLKDGALPFRYLPPTLILFSWMSSYEEATSRKIWIVIQSLLILGSFYFIYQILIMLESPHPLKSITFSFFLFYRYFLDALYCGQVSGMIFLGFTLALYFWVKGKNNFSNMALLFLFLLKIIPGFLMAINFISSKDWKHLAKLVFYMILSILVVHGVYFFWFIVKFGFNNISELVPTYKSWLDVVLADKDYFDGSTAKNQAARGVILRFFGSSEKSESIWKITSLFSLLALLVFWFKLKMQSLRVRVYAFCLGILMFVLLMPQSLPYQILNILIPSVFVMSEFLTKNKNYFWMPLLGVLLFCTLSTTDLIGFKAAEQIQYYSLPFYTFILIGALLVREIILAERQNTKVHR